MPSHPHPIARAPIETEAPNRARLGGHRFDRILPVAAVALILVASLANFLNHNDYPLHTPEVGIVVGALLLLALVLGLVYAAAGGVLRILLDVMLVYVALDLNFDGLGVPVAAMAVAVLLNRHVIPVLAIVFGVVLITELLAPMLSGGAVEAKVVQSAPAQSDAPVLLHLILDEHIGIEGLPAGMPKAWATRTHLQSFYAAEGFRLYGGAYSEYLRTVNAIPHILNVGVEQDWEGEHKDGFAITSNAYFNRLHALGYAINVYQSDFVDYCAAVKVQSCHTENAAGLGPIADSTLSVRDKAAVLMFSFWSLSDFVRVGAHLYDTAIISLAAGDDELPLLDFEASRLVSTVTGLAAMDRLVENLKDAKPGEAYFAHVLLPHYPYVTRPDCSLKEKALWLSRGSPVPIGARQRAYFDQLACATRKVGAALDSLDSAGVSNVVVIHGDHGSRITTRDPTVENAGRFDAEDVVSTFSTLFAIRAAGIESGYETARLPLAGLLAAFVQSDFRSAPLPASPAQPSVVLDDSDWKPVRRHDLPADWLHTEENEAVEPAP